MTLTHYTVSWKVDNLKHPHEHISTQGGDRRIKENTYSALSTPHTQHVSTQNHSALKVKILDFVSVNKTT